MAGETTGSTLATRQARLAKGTPKVAMETLAFSATETEAADVKLFRNIRIPSNAVIVDVAVYNDVLDSVADLAQDIGLAASEEFTSTTSGTDTVNAVDAILDADALVDGTIVGQAATTSWTSQALDAVTLGPDDCEKACWEILGYDNDPKAMLCIALTTVTAAATGAAGDLAIKVTYLVD